MKIVSHPADTQPDPRPGAGTGSGYVCPGCGATAIIQNRATRRAQRRNRENVPPGAAVITHADGCRHQAASFRATLDASCVAFPPAAAVAPTRWTGVRRG